MSAGGRRRRRERLPRLPGRLAGGAEGLQAGGPTRRYDRSGGPGRAVAGPVFASTRQSMPARSTSPDSGRGHRRPIERVRRGGASAPRGGRPGPRGRRARRRRAGLLRQGTRRRASAAPAARSAPTLSRSCCIRRTLFATADRQSCPDRAPRCASSRAVASVIECHPTKPCHRSTPAASSEPPFGTAASPAGAGRRRLPLLVALQPRSAAPLDPRASDLAPAGHRSGLSPSPRPAHPLASLDNGWSANGGGSLLLCCGRRASTTVASAVPIPSGSG